MFINLHQKYTLHYNSKNIKRHRKSKKNEVRTEMKIIIDGKKKKKKKKKRRKTTKKKGKGIRDAYFFLWTQIICKIWRTH